MSGPFRPMPRTLSCVQQFPLPDSTSDSEHREREAMRQRGGGGFERENGGVTQSRNAYYKPHAHDGLTTHLLLKGSIEVGLPEKMGEEGEKGRHGLGERVDIPPNTAHEVWVGSEGATMVIGK